MEYAQFKQDLEDANWDQVSHRNSITHLLWGMPVITSIIIR